ncbi:TetR/AcrR family transcriptional regulator [Agromyces intestinalis]|uniref:TetR/AcrR family transcriptional regulator n=1 Tax=Agromyces intestinalis TaxID=2592652 RepID=A0A5C1YH96_9MICO|nr:TetR/AcrR family transcriptional regulator [Agromyces intestinalis]QEO14417.1 TetR/AcrR family transcriptional regulator [Agromyces intestinalis]
MDDAAKPEPTPGSSTPARGSYRKGVARRQEILDRAIEVFAERGARGTSLRAIGEAIGVSHAALRHYFDSREELLVAVYVAAAEREAVEDPDDDETSVVGVMTHAARRNQRVPGLVQLYTTLVANGLEAGHPEARRFAADRFANIRVDLIERIRRDQAAGRVRADLEPVAVASLVIAASDGLQTQWLLDPAIDPTPSLELLERLLAPPAPPGRGPEAS